MQIIQINIHRLIIALSINQLTIQQTSLQRTVNYQNIPSRLLNSSSSIPTLNHSINSAFPFNQHANPPIIHTSAHNFAENESGYNSTNNCSKNINYQNIIVQASYKSCSIIFTANYPISPAFPFEHHANPLTIY